MLGLSYGHKFAVGTCLFVSSESADFVGIVQASNRCDRVIDHTEGTLVCPSALLRYDLQSVKTFLAHVL